MKTREETLAYLCVGGLHNRTPSTYRLLKSAKVLIAAKLFFYDKSFPNLAWLYSLLDCSGGHGIVCGIYQNQAYSI